MGTELIDMLVAHLEPTPIYAVCAQNARPMIQVRFSFTRSCFVWERKWVDFDAYLFKLTMIDALYLSRLL